MDYRCNFCRQIIPSDGYAIIDETQDFIFCDNGNDDNLKIGERRPISSMSHAYQYVIKNGKAIFEQRIKVSDITKLFPEFNPAKK